MTFEISPDAWVSPDARIFPSVRGTKISIGAGSKIFEFAVIRAVGGIGDVVIGQYSNINPHCVLYSGNGIHIGNNVLIAASCNIMPTNHETADLTRSISEQGFASSKGGIVIEDDVWIGSACTILDGAHIGKGAVIGACSLVRGRIDPYTVWAGVPAVRIRAR